jgi:RNA polymerase sigma-70 factor (ECF subfamily)
MDQLTDSQIIEKVKAGETELFSELVQKYQNKIFAYVYKIVNHKEEAEDIVQETFIKVYKNLNSFDADRKFSSWLYRISHNETINYLKKNKKVTTLYYQEGDYLFNSLKYEKDLIKELITKEDDQRLKMVLEKLPFKYKEVIILKYLEDKSYEEIAQILNKPINTIGTLINRAKKHLKELLTDD